MRACVRVRARACVHVHVCVCVCVCVCYIVDNSFHLDVHYVCHIMHVQRFEPQGGRFTNSHYYYDD